ncbi:hypothetical protein [Hungatella hathewayi]|uniref:hypothetical protein n=1 Tax=Hungatella hathewayi TaxID=154046 RepID=UPI003567C42D
MAKILKTNSQEQALKEIVDSLKVVSALNEILDDEDMSECKIRINGTTKSGQINEQIPIPFTMIASQLKDYRKRMVKEIQDKSKNYSIKLDENENEIISMKKKKEADAATNKPVETESKLDEFNEESESDSQPSSYTTNNSYFGNHYTNG